MFGHGGPGSTDTGEDRHPAAYLAKGPNADHLAAVGGARGDQAVHAALDLRGGHGLGGLLPTSTCSVSGTAPMLRPTRSSTTSLETSTKTPSWDPGWPGGSACP